VDQARPAILCTVRPESVEGLSGVVKDYAGLLTVGRGLPGSKLLGSLACLALF